MRTLKQRKGGRYFTFHAASLDQLKKPADSKVAGTIEPAPKFKGGSRRTLQ